MKYAIYIEIESGNRSQINMNAIAVLTSAIEEGYHITSKQATRNHIHYILSSDKPLSPGLLARAGHKHYEETTNAED